MKASLPVFDLDATLAGKWGKTLPTGVAQRVPALDSAIAVATSQADVAWNAIEAKPYPRPAQIGRRLVNVAEALPRLREALWLVAIADESFELAAEDVVFVRATE
jgi:hypothetical protein